jgi:hypothetical protein
MVVAPTGRKLRIAMEYSEGNAIPYISRVDAGTKEMVEQATGAEIDSSADLTNWPWPCSPRNRSPDTAPPPNTAWPLKMQLMALLRNGCAPNNR